MKEQRPVALLDVDHTLLFDENTLNTQLLDALKSAGISDFYLLTDMTYKITGIQERNNLVRQLRENGFVVHGVITPQDLVWNSLTSEKALKFKEVTNNQLNRSKRLSGESLESILKSEKDELELSDDVLMYQSVKNEPGSGYEDAVKAFHTSTEEDREYGRPLPEQIQTRSVTAKILSDRLAEQKGYTDTKGLLLDLFMKHKPTWVNSIIVMDDKPSVIDSIERFKTETHPDLAITAVHVSSQDMDYNAPIRAHLDSKLITVKNYRKLAQDYIDNSLTRMPNDAVAITKRKIVSIALDELDNVDNDAVIRINEFRLKLKESLDNVSLSMRNDSAFMYLLKCVGVVLSGGLAYSAFFGKEATKGGRLLKEVESDVVMVDEREDLSSQPFFHDPDEMRTEIAHSLEELPQKTNRKLPTQLIIIGDPIATYGTGEDKKANSEQCQIIKELLLQFPDVTENNFEETQSGTIFRTKGTSFEVHFCESSEDWCPGKILVTKDNHEMLIKTLPTFYGRGVTSNRHEVFLYENSMLEAINRTSPSFKQG